MKFPRSIEDAKQLGLVLSRYKEKYYIQVILRLVFYLELAWPCSHHSLFQVLGGVFVTYLFLQTFAIPGSIFLSIVSGYLFPFQVALLLVSVALNFMRVSGASFQFDSVFISDLFLLCNRGFLLLLTKLSGWPEACQEILARKVSRMGEKSRQSQRQSFELHNFSAHHSVSPELVYQHCLACD